MHRPLVSKMMLFPPKKGPSDVASQPAPAQPRHCNYDVHKFDKSTETALSDHLASDPALASCAVDEYALLVAGTPTAETLQGISARLMEALLAAQRSSKLPLVPDKKAGPGSTRNMTRVEGKRHRVLLLAAVDYNERAVNALDLEPNYDDVSYTPEQASAGFTDLPDPPPCGLGPLHCRGLSREGKTHRSLRLTARCQRWRPLLPKTPLQKP